MSTLPVIFQIAHDLHVDKYLLENNKKPVYTSLQTYNNGTVNATTIRQLYSSILHGPFVSYFVVLLMVSILYYLLVVHCNAMR